jgi:undecaprenyl diphosphate synthase
MDMYPRHVAFIMDGNRRWARKHALSLFLGHESGAKRIEPLVDYAISLGITHLTFWAFSTENWERSEEEVKDIMNVFRQALHDPMVVRLQEKKVKVQVIGDLTPFPDDIRSDVEQILSDSKANEQMTVNIALNYGGRVEILRAFQKLLDENKTAVSENEFSELLYTAGQPDPDLIIRTGGERRLSGYLPWQAVYAELYFTPVLWPDFTPDEFGAALKDYESRQRRFGK